MSDLPDFYAGGADVVLRPEWAAKEGTDKNYYATAADQLPGGTADVTYAVPANKTLFICGVSFALYATLAADADKNQIGNGYIFDVDTALPIGIIGGSGGNGVVFAKPVVFTTGKTMRAFVTNLSGHNCSLYVTAWGYEL